MTLVTHLVDRLSKKSIDIFEDLRSDGLRNPMSENEIDDFVSFVKRERHAAC